MSANLVLQDRDHGERLLSPFNLLIMVLSKAAAFPGLGLRDPELLA